MSKKCKKALIFTLIFTLKTNMSYKIILLSITNRPIFKVFIKNPPNFNFFYLFFTLSYFTLSSGVYPPLRMADLSAKGGHLCLMHLCMFQFLLGFFEDVQFGAEVYVG